MPGGKPINTEIDVLTGDIVVIKNTGVIKVPALGSCIALIMYDKKNKIGGVAHIMLPGASPKTRVKEKFKYAENAIDETIKRMLALGSDYKKITCGIIGAANVLRKKDDEICVKNIESVIGYLKEKKLEIVGSSIGGQKRRSVALDTETGEILYTVGNSGKKKLKKTDL